MNVVLDMFKVNDKDIKTTLLGVIMYIYCQLWINFKRDSCVFTAIFTHLFICLSLYIFDLASQTLTTCRN